MTELKLDQCQDQANAWLAVCEVLNNIDSMWGATDKTGREAAVLTIKKLAKDASHYQAANKELVEALSEAAAALAGGLWDYGPGQDEHIKCDEVIERCNTVLAKHKEQQ